MDDADGFTVLNGLVLLDSIAFSSRFAVCELWACLPWDAECWVIDV